MEDLLIVPFFSWIYITLYWITGSFLFSLVFGWVDPRLIVIDGLDECADNETQSHILRAAATATKRLRRPFRILIICRPEIHIMRTLKESAINFVPLDLGQYNANHDIQHFLSDKFEELKQHHPLAEHGSFPTSWPGSDVIEKIAENASGQFIYASVVMAYIECSKHSPVDRLNFILRLSPTPDRHSPFDTLDALYTHIFASVEGDLLMRQILGFMAIPRMANDGLGEYTTPIMIAELLSPVGISNVFLILEQLRSVISSTGPDKAIKFWHASISDFLLDEARSKEFFVDIQMAHETLARGYLRLFQIQPLRPDHSDEPPFFSLFLKHCERAFFSENLQQDLVVYDLFSAYKAAVGEPTTLQKLQDVWESERVPQLFRTLVLHPQGQRIVDVYVDGLYRNYPLEPCIIKLLQSFLDSKKPEIFDAAIYHAFYVPLLHHLLNGDGAAFAASLAEKSVNGVLRVVQFMDLVPLSEEPRVAVSGRLSRPEEPMGFLLACQDCLSILLPHTSHYSTELVDLLIEQQRETSRSSGIRLKATMVRSYLEQFEDHPDAPPELKVFIDKYWTSKRQSHEIGGGIQTLRQRHQFATNDELKLDHQNSRLHPLYTPDTALWI